MHSSLSFPRPRHLGHYLLPPEHCLVPLQRNDDIPALLLLPRNVQSFDSTSNRTAVPPGFRCIIWDDTPEYLSVRPRSRWTLAE